jgi:chloramphenicol-sensitive protein RarD
LTAAAGAAPPGAGPPVSSIRPGLIAGVAGNLMWGLTPLLFIALGRLGAQSWEIVGQRALWSAPWALGLVLATGQLPQVRRALRERAILGQLLLSAVAITTSWSLYVWAVNNGHNLDASLGYYINPLMNVAAGAVIFRERIDRIGVFAIALAVAGVGIQTLAVGHLPMISLALAATFWVYGFILRQVAVDAQAGLFIQSLFLAGPGLGYVLWLRHSGGGLFGHGLGPSLLMSLVGPATVAPLALFAWSARRLPFGVLGFLQFISPTVGFAIGVWAGEPMTPLRLLSFAFIWAALAVFAVGLRRASHRAAAPASEDDAPERSPAKSIA